MSSDSYDLEPAQSPPMLNGEVQFDAPWQGRVFGMAHSLAAAGVFPWDDFRDCLIAELAQWGDQKSDTEFAYYDHFQRALETLLANKGIVPGAALAAREQLFAQRPHGHDHSH